MSKSSFVSRVPYDALMTEMCGEWRKLQGYELDAVWGMAIVHAVLDGVEPDVYKVANHLGVNSSVIEWPFDNLSQNGAFQGMIERDKKALKSYDKSTWGYYGGYACGYAGPYNPGNYRGEVKNEVPQETSNS